MKIQGNNYGYRESGKELLLEGCDFKLFGFYDSIGLELDDAMMLQPIYLIDGKYYVMFRDDDVLSGIIFKLDMICDMYKKDKDKMYHVVSEFMSHFDASIFTQEKYKMLEIDIRNVHNLILFADRRVLMADDFNLYKGYCNGAILLDDGRIAVGDELFLERVILDNIKDKKRRYELLEDLYYNFCNFEKREEVIKNFYNDFYSTINSFEKEMWDDKRINNYLVLYAFCLLGPLNIDFREIKVDNSVEEKKWL